MSDIEDLDRRVREQVAAANQRRELHRDHNRQRMEETDRRHAQFRSVAERIDAVVRPRVQRVAQHFNNAQMREPAQTGVGRCTCFFEHTDRFPATTTLEFLVSTDERMQNALVCYKLEIRPVFFAFEGHDQFVVPLDELDETKIALWVDQRLIGFVDTYLRLEEADAYQSDNFVTDPVCGMRINKMTAAAEAEHGGKRFYFCVEDCRRKFLEGPKRYASTAD